MVDDAEVEAGLAALVLGTHPLQLVLPGGHLHEAGVGVDEDGVEVVHLDVSLEAYLLFAAEGAARRGARRSVKTLSGGESFKASLALALGLSDEVQSAAGGIRLDTLFLDEGFGSLDDESLEQAIRVLAGLTEGDRLVGIISHVAALKERIDKQVVVKKARSGGSTVEVIV